MTFLSTWEEVLLLLYYYCYKRSETSQKCKVPTLVMTPKRRVKGQRTSNKNKKTDENRSPRVSGQWSLTFVYASVSLSRVTGKQYTYVCVTSTQGSLLQNSSPDQKGGRRVFTATQICRTARNYESTLYKIVRVQGE